MFKRHWHIKGKRTPLDTGAEAYLASRGIQVIDANAFLKPPSVKERQQQQPLPENWNNQPCYLFKDENVLLEGVAQAQALLNTLKVDGYPEKVEDFIHKTSIPTSVDKNLQQSILNACVFDAEQTKLRRKIKDPERPAYNFPRVYGISDHRKMNLLYNKLIQNCERLAGQCVLERRFLNDAIFKSPFYKDSDLVQLELGAEILIVARKPLNPVNEQKRLKDLEIPNIFPIKSTVSIPKTNIYVKETVYPILKPINDFAHLHTLLLHFEPFETTNLFETPVRDSQFEARAMLKAFAAASSRAKLLQGEDVTNLKHPIVVQAIQTDGKRYQFGIFQLNTLNLDNNSPVKNVWYGGNIINLYEECAYKTGKPHLEGYNKDVLRHMLAFYTNS